MLIFFYYSGPSEILSSDGNPNTAYAGARGHEIILHFPLVLINRLNKTESAVF